jgi:transcriptional regulator with XRE-family HTH domain
MVVRIGPRSGKRIPIFFREWRERKQLTQEQLADRLGTTKATVSRMENSESQYNRGYLEALAEALDIDDPAKLLHHPDRPSPDDLLRNATPEQRARAISVIEALLKAG